MTAELEIVAVGARTPVGLTAASSAAAVRAGISRLREFPFLSRRGDPIVAGPDARLDDALEGRARMLPMLVSVFDELLHQAGGPALLRAGCDVLVALPEARPGFSEADASWIVQSLRDHVRTLGAAADVRVAGRGHAGGVAAVEAATQLAPRKQTPLFFVLGVDSYLAVPTLMWLEGRRLLAQLDTPGGLNPGEGAGGLLLTTKPVRRQLARAPLASLRGVATGRELQTRESDAGSLGVGLSQAVLRASSSLSLPKEAADAVYCDINGERYRSEEWGFFALRAPNTIKVPQYEAPCDCWGDVGAASATLGAVLAVQSFARGHAPGPRALVMAGSESGLRGAMILEAPG